MRRAQCTDRHVKISAVLVSFTSLKGQLKAADLKYSAFSFPDTAHTHIGLIRIQTFICPMQLEYSAPCLNHIATCNRIGIRANNVS